MPEPIGRRFGRHIVLASVYTGHGMDEQTNTISSNVFTTKEKGTRARD